MYYFEIALFVIGLLLLVMGYRRNHRNLLLCAAITLFLAGTAPSMVVGASSSSWAVSWSASCLRAVRLASSGAADTSLSRSTT